MPKLTKKQSFHKAVLFPPLVFSYKCEKILVAPLACGNGERNFCYLVVRWVNTVSVDLKKKKQDEDSDALIAVHKGVVCNKRMTDAGGFFLNGRIQLRAVKGGVCGLKGAT